MKDIDPQDYGQYKGKVDALESSVKEIKTVFKEGFSDIKQGFKQHKVEVNKIVKDHMDNEEADNDEFNKRLKAVEEMVKFGIWTIKWVFPVLIFLAPILIPILQQMVFKWMLPGVELSDLVTFVQITNF